MIKNRKRIAAALLAGWLGSAVAAPSIALATDVSTSTRVAELKDQLLNGLRAGRPQDREYLIKVAEMVDSGALPRDLVVTTFIWAKRKKEHKVQYFQRALQERALKIGIKL